MPDRGPSREGRLPRLGGGAAAPGGTPENARGKPSSPWKPACNFARSQRCCQGQTEIPNQSAMSEKPLRPWIQAHRENAIYSAYLIRIRFRLSPRGSESPNREGTE